MIGDIMERNHSIVVTSWIIVICCFMFTSAHAIDEKSRDFSVLKNVLEASKVDSCDEVPKTSTSHKRLRRSVDDEDLGEPTCLEETDPIYYVSKYHRGVCHVSVELAYEVFFGRSPSKKEFKKWYDKCVMREIDEAYLMWKFAESEEHMEFLGKKRKEKEEKDEEEGPSESSSEMEIDAEVEMEIPVTVPLKLRVEDKEYLDALNDTESDEFKELADSYADALVELLREMPGLLGVKILGFRKGSLIIFYELVFDEHVKEAPKLYDGEGEIDVDYDSDPETFDQERFAEKIKEKVRGVIEEAIETNELQRKLNNTKLGDLHIDLESVDTVPEDVINDLVKKNPKAPIVPLDVRNHNSTNMTEGELTNGQNVDTNTFNTTSENLPQTVGPTDDSKIDNEKEMEYSGNSHEGTDNHQADIAANEESPTDRNSTNHDTENSRYENEDYHDDTAGADDVRSTPTSSMPDSNGNYTTVSTTPRPLEEDGLIPIEYNHSTQDISQAKESTTVPTYFTDTTTVPPSYPEIPAVGTLGEIEYPLESSTMPSTAFLPLIEATSSSVIQPTSTAKHQATASGSITTNSPISYSTAHPTTLFTTQTAQPSVVNSEYYQLTTTMAATQTAAEITTEVTTVSLPTTIPQTTISMPSTEGSTTTGFSEWDTEYLDSLDDGDNYDYSYYYENEETHDDVTVLDTTTIGLTTAPPSNMIEETSEESNSTTSNENILNDDISTPHYDDTKLLNTTQQNNESMTQISPTPERAHSADITRSANSNKTSPSQTVMMKLRVTNMNYTHNLTDRQSEEFQLLEAKFRQLLRPLLQSLDGFVDMEVLGFSYGSLIVNNEIQFEKTVPENVKHEVRERIRAASAYFKYAHLAVDTDFTEVLKPDEADLCEFVQCHLYANCVVRNDYKTECICLPGYTSIDPTQCVSVCNLDPEYCQNGGECETIPGRGPVCRCKVSFNWGFKGERCEEPLPRSVLLVSASTGVACVVFFILLAGFCYSLHRRKRIAKAQKKQKMADKDFMRAAQIMSSPVRRPANGELQRVNPVFVTEDETLSSSDNIGQGNRRSPTRPPSVISSDKSIGSMSTQSFYLREHMENNGPLPSDLNTPESQLLRLQIQNYPDHIRTWGSPDALNAMRYQRRMTGEAHTRAARCHHNNQEMGL